jgi:ParB family chromosome partitioning protein
MAIFLLFKAKKAQIGEIRHRINGPHKKIGTNKWVLVKKVGSKWVLVDKKSKKKKPVLRVKKPAKDSGVMPYVDIDDIRPEKQIRTKFDEESIKDLSGSIAENGLIQPITVRPDKKNPGKYTIIAGERRWRAMQKLKEIGQLPEGKPHISGDKTNVVIMDVSDKDKDRLQGIENLQRVDNTPMEVAKWATKMIDAHGYNQSQLAIELGKSPKYVSDHLKLNNLDSKVQGLLEKKAITKKHAILLTDMSVNDQLKWSNKIVQGSWTAKHFERELRIHDAKQKEQAFFTKEEGMTTEQLSAHERLKEMNQEPDRLRDKFQRFFEKQVGFVNSFLDEDGVDLSSLGLIATGNLDISMKHLESLQGAISNIMSKMKQKRYEMNVPGLFKSSTLKNIKMNIEYKKLCNMYKRLKMYQKEI